MEIESLQREFKLENMKHLNMSILTVLNFEIIVFSFYREVIED